MNYELYKTVHYISILTLLVSLILMILFTSLGDKFQAAKKKAFALHGISWLVLFASAFGLVSATGLHENFPVWGKIKTTIWLLLGLIPLVIKRKPQLSYVNAVVIFGLFSAAIYLAVYKPF